MRACKLIVAILTIIEGIGVIIGGVGIAILGFFWQSFEKAVLQEMGFAGNIFGGFIAIIASLIMIICVAVGIVFLVLGIKFCSTKPNKGIAITLIVLYGLAVLGLTFSTGFGGILVIAQLALSITYLVLLIKSEKNQPQVQLAQPQAAQPQEQSPQPQPAPPQ